MIKVADIILIICLFAIAAVTAVFASNTGTYAADAKLVVTIGGEVHGTYSLAEEQEIVINDKYNNLIVIEQGGEGKMQARILDANCPGQDCVRHAPINLSGQNIICLPNKMILEIRDGEGDIDAYTY